MRFCNLRKKKGGSKGEFQFEKPNAKFSSSGQALENYNKQQDIQNKADAAALQNGGNKDEITVPTMGDNPEGNASIRTAVSGLAKSDADGEFDEQDYELLQWFYDESTEDVDGDGFFDEEDFFLSQWLEGEEAEDFNGDGFFDEDDFILFQENSGIFENEIFYVFIEPGFNHAIVEWETAEPGAVDSVYYRPVDEEAWQAVIVAADAEELDFDELFEHFVTLTDLQPDTEYEIQVRSISLDGFATEVYEDDFRTRRDADLRPAVILDYDYEADLQEIYAFWETNRLTDARYVVRKVANGQVVAADTLDREGDFVHDIEIAGLEAGTEYEVTVASAPVGLEGVAVGAPETDAVPLGSAGAEALRCTPRASRSSSRFSRASSASAESALIIRRTRSFGGLRSRRLVLAVVLGKPHSQR